MDHSSLNLSGILLSISGGVIVLILTWLGTLVRGVLEEQRKHTTDIALLNKTMLPRVDHDVICEQNWQKIHDRFDVLGETLERREDSANKHRQQIVDTLQIVVTKIAVFEDRSKRRRPQSGD